MKEGISGIFNRTKGLVREVAGGILDLTNGGNSLEYTVASEISPDLIRQIVKKYALRPDPRDVILEKKGLRLLRGAETAELPDPPVSPGAA